ncbi:MAG: hypothetical protein E7E64_00265 [Clostridium celatum]|nr:hypothetical protein [Clostridium celatum]MDU2120960.1 hypothetical protein [Clostridium celatum]MDU4978532.1 hypothetical protein [Clostridium celatum]
MLRKFIFLDTETLEDYYLSIDDNEQENNIKKFNKLYKYLEENNIKKDINDAIENFKIGDIIETTINVKVPTLYKQIKQAKQITPIISCVQELGMFSMKSMEDIRAFQGVKEISRLIKDEDIPIIGSYIEKNNKIKIITYINDKFLKGDLNEIEGEVKIVGKIKSVIGKGKGIDIYSMLPEMKDIIYNREQRRKLKNENKDIVGHIVGPAIEIYTLAIYR